MRLLLLLSFVFITGCGSYVTGRQKEVAAQALSDMYAVADYVEYTYDGDVPALASDAMRNHARNMGKAMEIDVEDLPSPRVSTRDWQDNPSRAHQESRDNSNKDSADITRYGLYAMAGVSVAMLAGKAGMMMFANHPIGQFLGMFGQLFGGESPKKHKVYKKMIAVLEEYKEIDPEWRTNKLYAMLSDRLTTAEKDFIKTERENV